MTATPSMTPKKTATTGVLAGIGIAALVFALNLVLHPVEGKGWRHETSVTAAPMMAPVQTRGSNSEGVATAASGEATISRGRN